MSSVGHQPQVEWAGVWGVLQAGWLWAQAQAARHAAVRSTGHHRRQDSIRYVLPSNYLWGGGLWGGLTISLKWGVYKKWHRDKGHVSHKTYVSDSTLATWFNSRHGNVLLIRKWAWMSLKYPYLSIHQIVFFHKNWSYGSYPESIQGYVQSEYLWWICFIIHVDVSSIKIKKPYFDFWKYKFHMARQTVTGGNYHVSPKLPVFSDYCTNE